MIEFRFLIVPHFVAKYYLLRDIHFILKKYQFKGTILDVGCGEKPYKGLFKDAKLYYGIDLNKYSKNDTFKSNGPDTYFTQEYLKTLILPFLNNSFDHAVSFQVLEHHKKPEKLIEEMARVVKRKGYILITAPFIWGLHEEPNDFQRFTKYGLIKLLEKENCKVIELKEQGAICSTITILMIDYLIEFANKNRIAYILAVFIYPLFLFCSYSCLLLDKIFVSKKIILNYLVLAQKTRNNIYIMNEHNVKKNYTMKSSSKRTV